MDAMQNTVLPLYIAFLARSATATTVRAYLSGVRVFYETRGKPNPLQDHFGLRHMLKGVDRLRPGTSKRKLPITMAILSHMVASCDPTTPAGAATAVAAVVAFFAFLRKANVTAGKQTLAKEFTHALTAGNVWVHYGTYTLWLRLTCTKTIQFSERVLYVPIKGIPGHPLDVVALWENHLRQSDLPRSPNSHAFAFQKKRGGEWTNLTHTNFVATVKATAKALGLDSSKYAAHSFRRGGATFAAACGVGPDLIKALGDWKSDAYQLYMCIQDHVRTSAASMMAAAASACNKISKP
jgi:hypothetical protein